MTNSAYVQVYMFAISLAILTWAQWREIFISLIVLITIAMLVSLIMFAVEYTDVKRSIRGRDYL